MRVQRRDSSDAIATVIGMVTDPVVLEAVARKWSKKGLFSSSYLNTIGKLCVDHWHRYRRAPGGEIKTLFASWAEKNPHAEEFEHADKTVGRILQRLNDEYEQQEAAPHSQHVLDIAKREFERVQLDRLRNQIEIHLENRRLAEAMECVTSYAPFSLNGHHAEAAVDIAMTPFRWLWHGRFAAGQLTMVDGDPGLGKSQVLLDMAARVSRGWMMPPQDRKPHRRRRPANSMILGLEDSWESTVVPRLVAAGADLKRVYRPTTTDPIEFPRDLPVLEQLLARHRIKFLVLDPASQYVGERTDTNAEPHVRRMLARLQAVAERTGVAVALVRHMGKSHKGKAIYAGLGSIAWTAYCRLQLTVARHPSRDVIVLASGKHNPVKTVGSLCFEIVSATVRGDHKRRISTSKIEWIGEASDIEDADDLLARSKGRPDRTHDAVELIRQLLNEGPMDAVELQRMVMEECGVSERTYKHAKKEAGARKKRVGFGANGKWTVSLDAP